MPVIKKNPEAFKLYRTDHGTTGGSEINVIASPHTDLACVMYKMVRKNHSYYSILHVDKDMVWLGCSLAPLE